MKENTGLRSAVMPVLLTLAAFTATAQDGSGFVKQKQWIKSCQNYKNAYSRLPQNALKLGTRPGTAGAPRFWVLKWNGHQVPVPAIAYKRLRINEAGLVLSDNRHGITIRHHHQLYDNIRQLNTTRIYEVFDVPQNQAETAWKHFFGQPMNIAQFLQKSYQYSIEDLQCKPETLRKNLPILTYLIFKKSISNDGQAYKIRDDSDSFVVESRLKDSLVFNAYLVDAGSSNQVTELTIYAANSAAFKNLGLYIDRPETQAKARPGPAWLVQLQKALESRQGSDWDKLAQLLKKQGFDQQSSASVTRWRHAGDTLAQFSGEVKTLSTPYIDLKKWVRLCALVREELRATPNATVTYTNPDHDSRPLKFWTLRWNGFYVPVPYAKYSKIIISPDKNSKRKIPAITLRTQASHGQKVVKMYATNSTRITRSAKNLAQLPPRLQWLFDNPARDSSKAWGYYFGRPLQGYDRYYAMYQYSITDLTCRPAQHKQELPILYYLLGKQGMRQKVRAYRLDKPLAGYIVEKDYTDTRHTGWDVTLRAKDPANGFYKIYITTPKSSSRLGASIGRQNKHPSRPEPAWLRLLQRALDSGKKQDWEKLQAELKKPVYDKTSAVSVENWLRLPGWH